MHLDFTVRLSDIILLVGGLLAALRVLVSDQEIKQQLATMMEDHEKRLTQVEERTDLHQTWLIRSRLDQIPLGRRSYDHPARDEK